MTVLFELMEVTCKNVFASVSGNKDLWVEVVVWVGVCSSGVVVWVGGVAVG